MLQEIENAYRNFLLRWIESPLTIPEEAKPILSPISQTLFDKMRISVLKRVDDLLFSSSKPRKLTKVVQKRKDLSSEQNLKIYQTVAGNINDNEAVPLSLYRISLFLFNEWTEGDDYNFLNPKFKKTLFCRFSKRCTRIINV